MPRQQAVIPINEGWVESVDEVALQTHNAALIDVYVDELGMVNRRPGLTEFCDLGTSTTVDGLFWWEREDVAIAVSGGYAYKITDQAGTNAQLTGEFFTPTKPVTFADFGSAIYAADQGVLKKISLTATAEHADSDAPANASHVAFLDKYLLANLMGTRQVHRSEVNEPDDFRSNFFSAEAQYDDLQSIVVANQELYLFGDRTMEAWFNDGTTPFIRLPAGFVQSGTVARYTPLFCQANDSLVWLDQDRRLVTLNGRTPISLSSTMSKLIAGFTTVNDAIGIYVVIEARPYYILTFPSEERTLVYDFKTSALRGIPYWYEWSYYDSVGAAHVRFRGNCHCLATAWNLSLVGDRANGKVYKFDTTSYTDDGDTIRSVIRTGSLDRGSHAAWKMCNRVDFRVKKTAPGGGTTVSLLVKYRDNGRTTWSNEQTVLLSAASGETDYMGHLNRLGRYKSRQWQFTLTDNAPLAMLPPIETFTL